MSGRKGKKASSSGKSKNGGGNARKKKTNNSKYVVKKNNNLVKKTKQKNVKKCISPKPIETVIPLVDPWKSLKSPYGGKASPVDEYNELLANVNYWFHVRPHENTDKTFNNTNVLSPGLLFSMWVKAEENYNKNTKSLPFLLIFGKSCLILVHFSKAS